jgi:hypothetical protein
MDKKSIEELITEEYSDPTEGMGVITYTVVSLVIFILSVVFILIIRK